MNYYEYYNLINRYMCLNMFLQNVAKESFDWAVRCQEEKNAPKAPNINSIRSSPWGSLDDHNKLYFNTDSKVCEQSYAREWPTLIWAPQVQMQKKGKSARPFIIVWNESCHFFSLDRQTHISKSMEFHFRYWPFMAKHMLRCNHLNGTKRCAPDFFAACLLLVSTFGFWAMITSLCGFSLDMTIKLLVCAGETDMLLWHGLSLASEIETSTNPITFSFAICQFMVRGRLLLRLRFFHALSLLYSNCCSFDCDCSECIRFPWFAKENVLISIWLNALCISFWCSCIIFKWNARTIDAFGEQQQTKCKWTFQLMCLKWHTPMRCARCKETHSRLHIILWFRFVRSFHGRQLHRYE